MLSGCHTHNSGGCSLFECSVQEGWIAGILALFHQSYLSPESNYFSDIWKSRRSIFELISSEILEILNQDGWNWCEELTREFTFGNGNGWKIPRQQRRTYSPETATETSNPLPLVSAANLNPVNSMQESIQVFRYGCCLPVLHPLFHHCSTSPLENATVQQ